jgi:hypothetical protein
MLLGTGLAPRAAGMLMLSSKATGSCTFGGGPGSARGMGGREDVLHGRLENTFVPRWLVQIRCWRVRKER